MSQFFFPSVAWGSWGKTTQCLRDKLQRLQSEPRGARSYTDVDADMIDRIGLLK